MTPMNCYGERMTSYHLGRSIGLIDRLEYLVLLTNCVSIPAELSNLEKLYDLCWIASWQQSHEANIQPVRFKTLNTLIIAQFQECPGLSDWLAESTFGRLQVFMNVQLFDRRDCDSLDQSVQTIAGVTNSAKHLRGIHITDPGEGSLGRFLVCELPRYTPCLEELTVSSPNEDPAEASTALSAIAQALQTAEFHEDFRIYNSSQSSNSKAQR
jgi:hypothetical protein